MEFGLGFSDELLRTSLMVVWDLMKPSWCPIPNADLILRATHGIQRELYADGNLRDLNIIYNLMTTSSRSNRENNVELLCWGAEDWIEPVTLAKRHRQLTILFGNIVMKAKT